MDLRGVFTALVTPFDAQGNLEEEVLRNNIRFQIAQGIDGLVALGTTGEAPTLSHEEERRILQIAKEEIKGRVPLIAGTGHYATSKTIENTLMAQEEGADAALIMTPYYNRPTQEGIYRHFKAIADAVKIPFIVYNHPGRTGQNIQTATLRRIAEIPAAIGVKETSGNISQIMDVVACMARHRPDFQIVSGDDPLALPLVAVGGHGVFSVISNLLPRETMELVHAALDGDFVKARECQYRLYPLLEVLFIETNPIPIKKAMNLCGIPMGECRLPMCDMLPENERKLRHVLEAMNLVVETAGAR